MKAFLELLLAAFPPLFSVLNIPGIMPLFIGMTETLESRERQMLLVRVLTAASVLTALMLSTSEVIFDVLRITVDDLRVGGGLILLIIAITDLAFGEQEAPHGEAQRYAR